MTEVKQEYEEFREENFWWEAEEDCDLEDSDEDMDEERELEDYIL